MSIQKKQRGFQKGESPNPNGRPKGSLNKSTSEYLKMKELAAENYLEAYAILWQKVKEGDMQAMNLYVKDLMPKIKEAPIVVEYPDTSVEGQIEALSLALASFNEHSRESVLSTLKILSDIKNNKSLAEQNALVQETREEVEKKIKQIEESIDYLAWKEENEHN